MDKKKQKKEYKSINTIDRQESKMLPSVTSSALGPTQVHTSLNKTQGSFVCFKLGVKLT